MYICANVEPCGSVRIVRFSCYLFKARVGGAQLTIFPTATRIRAELDDVKINESERGKGYGKQLIEEVLLYLYTYAEETGKPIHFGFTSRATREAANGMYTRMGFDRLADATPFGTNLYGKIVDPKEIPLHFTFHETAVG